MYQANVQTTGAFAAGDWTLIVLTPASIGDVIDNATAATPNDTDVVATSDSGILKKITWTNVKAFFKTYFDNLYEKITNRDASGGYVGLTAFKINFKNAANTFTSYFTNSNIASRTYTFQDKDGTIADTADVTDAINTAKAYADTLVVGLWDYRGSFTPSGSYPNTGGSGVAGAVLKGDVWSIEGLGAGNTGTVGTQLVEDGDTVVALVDTPGNTDANWVIGNTNVTPITLGNLINNSTAKTTPADSDSFGLVDSASGSILKKLSWANIKAALISLFISSTDTRVTTGSISMTSAGSMMSFTNGASNVIQIESTTHKVNSFVLDFPQSVQSYAEFSFSLPHDYNGGTITAEMVWMTDSASTNSVVWGVQGMALGDNSDWDTAYGSAQTVTDANNGTKKINITSATANITLSGSPASKKHFQLRVYRLGSGADNLAATARLMDVIITYTRA